MKRYIKSNTDEVLSKFKVGGYYEAPMLYGGMVYYKCVGRTADTVTLAESHISEDDGHRVDDGKHVHPIVLKDMYKYELEHNINIPDWDEVVGKKEMIETWEYRGDHGYMSSSNY